MGYFIIIRGPLGCGKSTVAKKLSKILKAEYVDIDKILEIRGLDKVSPDAECIPAQNFIKANEIVLPEVNRNLKNGKIVIFDACFYHREPIEHLIKNLQYPYHVFTLQAPVEVCIERDQKRKKTHGEDAAKAVHYLVSRFDYGTIIDITKPLDKVLAEILIHIIKDPLKNYGFVTKIAKFERKARTREEAVSGTDTATNDKRFAAEFCNLQ